jgi:hypothetical protein
MAYFQVVSTNSNCQPTENTYSEPAPNRQVPDQDLPHVVVNDVSCGIMVHGVDYFVETVVLITIQVLGSEG